MKRINNIYDKVCSLDNLILADKCARRGKAKQYGVITFDKQRGCNLLALHNCLMDGSFVTSPYTVFELFDPKPRQISALPYYPDRIVHHAIMNLLEPVFVSTFTADTYSCIKGRGIYAAKRNLEKALKSADETQYCLKMDIRKFYPSINHEVLNQLLRRKIKDVKLLELLDGIIASSAGIPIGNYLSQYFANFYLAYFDHWLKEVKGVKYYFRYADDMVILSHSKQPLHQLCADIKTYLGVNLQIQLKKNYQVFPVAKRGIDFIGYVFYHTHTLLRKTIKQNIWRSISRRMRPETMAAYRGWLIHCNSLNLQHKINEKLQTIRDKQALKKIRGRQDKSSAAA